MKRFLIALAILGVMAITADCLMSGAAYSKGDSRMEKISKSPQFKNNRFRNDVQWKQPSSGRYLSTMWKFLTVKSQRKPKGQLPMKKVNFELFNSSNHNGLNATWLGHSSLMLNIDGYKILLDPVFQKRVSIVGPTRYNGNVPLSLSQLPPVDVVIVSHNHYDHLNKYSIRFLNHKTKLFIVPLAVGAQLEKWGIPQHKIIELDWWEEYNVNEQLMIAATPSQHFSGRGLSDRDKTLWASFVIQGPNHKVFFSGDSGYFKGFKTIGKTYGPFDMTFMECGAYNEDWHHIHMYPEETVQAHLDVKGKILHPIHWGTFNLSLHSWYEPMERLSKAASEMNVETATPVVGDTTVFGQYIPSQKWWQPLMENQKSLHQKTINKKILESQTLIFEGATNESK